jgi:hypothetical protein
MKTKIANPARERSIPFLRRRHAAPNKCIIFSSGEFLEEPSRVRRITATGTPVCIRAGNAKIIIGAAPRPPHKRHGWSFLERLKFRIQRILHPSNGALDVSWLE